MTGFDFVPEDNKGGRAESFPASETVAIFDGDYICYACASAGEKRTILVTHNKSGNTKEFKTRTEFYGNYHKKAGGWLAKVNEGKKTPWLPEDFTIEDVQTAGKIENALHSVKSMVNTILDALETDKMEMFLGRGGSFRKGLSTLQEYKGNRKETLKPLLLDEVFEYMMDKYEATEINGIEVDDAVVIRAYGDPNAVVAALDKDAASQSIKSINPDKLHLGIIDGDCLGRLWLEGTGSKQKVRGYGRLHLYFQMTSADISDNYKANCHSDVKWAAKGAYNALCDCTTDAEALQVVVDTFKMLYPEPKQVKSYRGNDITISWYYVANEMFQMAKMLRHPSDMITFDAWCAEYEFNY